MIYNLGLIWPFLTDEIKINKCKIFIKSFQQEMLCPTYESSRAGN